MAIPLSAPTLGSYLTAVRDLLNQPDASNSFWSDAELVRYINEAIRMYFLEVTNNDEGFWTKTVSLDMVANVETVPLPADCFNVKAVYRAVTNGYVVLPYLNAESDSYSTISGGAGDTYLPSYYFRENSLVLRPVPNSNQTAALQVEYVYFPDSMSSAGDTTGTNVLPVFRQLIEMYAVYKAKMKESLTNGTDTSALAKANLGEIYKLFIDTVRNRSKFPQFVKAWHTDGGY